MINLQVAALALVSTLASCEPPVQGYNYRTPNYNTYNAQNSYLPPSTGYTAPTQNYLPPSSNYNGGYNPGHEDDGSYDHRHDHENYDHSHDHSHDSHVPKSYEFGYSVKDAQSGNDYDRRESSDGNVVRGEYRVQLPDGRTQIVTYHADWQTGFHADVRYEGEAKYPEPTNNYIQRQKQPSGYNYEAPTDFSGSLNGFHGNANTGYKQPSTAYGPPRYN